ncbi:MAG: ABC transporter substrate-binding protein [Eubacteriales bacterium]
MTKRITALILSLLCCLGIFTACQGSITADDDPIKGAEITMYLCEPVYDLDPALCYNNDSATQLCGLLFDTLFTVNSKGKVEKSLVKSYKIVEDEKTDEYYMMITLQDGNCWSDGTVVSAEDVVYAWKRILDAGLNSEAACLLFDIQNARKAKLGDCSIDDVGIYAQDSLTLQVNFEGKIDYDQFILNLTSPALAPLKESVVDDYADWSKRPATGVYSGPFMIRRVNYGLNEDGTAALENAELVLERNPYFRRVSSDKYLDKSVTPYRIIIDYSTSKEEQLDLFAKGEIFYVGDIALSLRANYKDQAIITDIMSTHTYYLNHNADIKKADGTTEKLFANKDVRLALSAAIDRDAIAQTVVFAKAASALVPYGVFDKDSAKVSFREIGGNIISTSADMAAAQAYIASSGINPSDYSFTISVRSEDEVHMAIATAVCAAWCQLGFNVTLDEVQLAINDEKYAGEDAKSFYDDTFSERFAANDFEVIAIDLIANTPDAFSILAPFARAFSGQGQDMKNAALTGIYEDSPHRTGYDSTEYEALIEEIFGIKNDVAARSAKLHDAEKMLLEDMPVIPIIFNQHAYLISGELSKDDYCYYGYHVFDKLKLKDYVKYLDIETDAE